MTCKCKAQGLNPYTGQPISPRQPDYNQSEVERLRAENERLKRQLKRFERLAISGDHQIYEYEHSTKDGQYKATLPACWSCYRVKSPTCCNGLSGKRGQP